VLSWGALQRFGVLPEDYSRSQLTGCTIKIKSLYF
jgi:hypothetical protein